MLATLASLGSLLAFVTSFAMGDVSRTTAVTPPVRIARSGDIESENLRTAGAIYFAWQLEEAKVFQVADRVVDLFDKGLLPLGDGGASTSSSTRVRSITARYRLGTSQRLDAPSRASLYAHFWGKTSTVADASSSVTPNHDFDELFTRLIDAIADLSRSPDSKARAIATAAVHRTGRDVATNVSQRGYGAAQFVARDLAKQISEAIELLSSPEVLGAFGARDMWQVVDSVAQKELGGAVNSDRNRQRGLSGRAILEWLANFDGNATPPLDPPKLSGWAESWTKTSEGRRSTLGKLDGGVTATTPSMRPTSVSALCFDNRRRLVHCAIDARSTR